MFIVKLLSKHVSGIIMPIIRRTRPCTTAYGVLLCALGRKLCIVHTAYDPASHNHSQHNQCRTPYAVIHGLVLLMMGIMMPETCLDRSLIINIGLVASCWFLCLHPTFMMRGHKNLKHKNILYWTLHDGLAQPEFSNISCHRDHKCIVSS